MQMRPQLEWLGCRLATWSSRRARTPHLCASIQRAVWLAGLALLLGSGALLGQGITPVVMHTGSGTSLSSQSVAYGPAGSTLLIDFGFATDEQPQPGAFLDSFTISITGPTGTGYLVTVDANGMHWTPLVPEALTVASASVQGQTSPFLAPTEGLASQTSYALGYTLPANWQNVPLTINFDLFDNQNTLRSLGYFFVPVPEPSGGALLLLGLVIWRYRVLLRKRCATDSSAGA